MKATSGDAGTDAPVMDQGRLGITDIDRVSEQAGMSRAFRAAGDIRTVACR